MPKIKVNAPFGLRLSSKTPPRDFAVGEHEISDAEHKHWFMAACLKDGRAVLLADGNGVKKKTASAGNPEQK